MTGPDAAECLRARLAMPGGPFAFYVHVPFCTGRCLFCGFAGSGPGGGAGARYCQAVEREIDSLALASGPRGPVRAVYFGGGTPSSMDSGDLSRLLSAARSLAPFANDCEITLEGAVHDFTRDRASEFIDAGFNRFSIGIQTFDTAVRRSMGRHLSGVEALARLRELCSMSMAAVVIDLIFGLPGQTIEIFERDLELAVSVGLDGLDTYQLNVFPDGALERAAEEGRVPPPAPLAAQGRYYALALERLGRMRFRQLSLSHFARGTRERNLYNPWAKSRLDCLSAGAGAGGFVSGWSFYRRADPAAYVERASRGDFAPDFVTAPHPAGEISSFLAGQMEEGALDLDAFRASYGPVPPAFQRILDNWRDAGLASEADGLVTLTTAGRFWGVNMAQAAIDALDEVSETNPAGRGSG